MQHARVNSDLMGSVKFLHHSTLCTPMIVLRATDNLAATDSARPICKALLDFDVEFQAPVYSGTSAGGLCSF